MLHSMLYNMRRDYTAPEYNMLYNISSLCYIANPLFNTPCYLSVFAVMDLPWIEKQWCYIASYTLSYTTHAIFNAI